MDDREEFRQAAAALAPVVRAQIQVALALRSEHGWCLCYGYAAFLSHVPDRVNSFSVETNSVRAARRLVIFKDEREVLAAIEAALAEPNTMEFESWQGTFAPLGGIGTTYEYERLHLARFPGPRRLPALTATFQNHLTFPSIKELDQELKAYSLPFDGVTDLLLEVGLPIPIDDLFNRHLRETVIIPPIDVLFDPAGALNSTFSNRQLLLVLTSHPNIDIAKIKFGVKTFHRTNPPGRYALRSEEITVDQAGYIRVNHETPPDIPLVQVFVSYADIFIGSWWIRDFGSSFNDRMVLHRAIDTNDQLRTGFFDQDRRNEFEDRMLMTLTLSGFTALKYGKIQTDASDIVAMSAGRHLFVVECTTGDINNKGKLQRLSDRTKQIAARLQGSPSQPIAIVPIIFTSTPRAETAAHWDIAASLGIAIAGRENIVGMLDILDAPPSPEQFFAAAISLIPAAKPSPGTIGA